MTARFARSYLQLDPKAREHCDGALGRLARDATDPALRLRRIAAEGPYREIRSGFRDRILFREARGTAVLLDVLSFREILRLARRAEHAVPDT